MAVATEKKWVYSKIEFEDIREYIETNAPQDKAWFKSIAYDTRPKKVSVDKLDKNGKPFYTQAKDKQGNLKFTEDGKPVMRKVKVYVPADNGETTEVYNHLKAKRAFCARYMPELLPKEGKKKANASDILKNW